jgi:hypothetical protein
MIFIFSNWLVAGLGITAFSLSEEQDSKIKIRD